MLYILGRLRSILEQLIAAAAAGSITRRMLQTLHFATLCLIEFYRDRCLSMASTIAFSAAFALVPVSTFYFSIFSAFPSFKEAILQAREFVVDSMVPQSTMKGEILKYLNELTSNVYGLTTLSVISLVLTSVLLFITIEDSLNTIFAVRKTPSLKQSLITFTNLLFWGPLLMGLSAYLWFESQRFASLATLSKSQGGHFGLTFLVSWLMFLAAYWLMPYSQNPLLPCLLGSFVGASLWELAKTAFGLYMQQAFMYSLVYGSVGFIPVTLLWIYTSCAILLFGAKVTFCYQHREMLELIGNDSERDPVLITHATLASLLLIARRFRNGEGPLDLKELTDLVKAPSHVIHTGLLALERARLVTGVNRRKDTFVLARGPETMSMREAFWCTYPQTAAIHSQTPEVLRARAILMGTQQAIDGVLQDRTVAQVLDEVDQMVRDRRDAARPELTPLKAGEAPVAPDLPTGAPAQGRR